jgi:broad specificity phosphatase PhoE
MPLGMNLTLVTRHGRSLFNIAGVVNGDPALDRGLDPSGIAACEALAHQLAAVRIDLCVVSEFLRAQQTADLALGERASGAHPVPRVVDSGLNDIRVGELEGRTLDDYREWKHGRGRNDPFPGGETLNDAARRYADAFERLLARPEDVVLVVCHEIPVRYVVNAAAGSSELDRPLHDIPNATPYLFDPDGLRRAVDRIRELAGDA